MVARPELKVDVRRSLNSEAGSERCPLCDQMLPHDLSATDLQARLRDHEQKAVRAQEQLLRTQFAQELTSKVAEAKRLSEVAAAERERAIRIEAKQQAATETKASLQKAQQEVLKAQQEKTAAEQREKRLREDLQAQVEAQTKKVLAEQREVFNKERAEAIAKVKADEFDKSQKLQKQVEVLSRQLEEETAGSLGEGAEIDLYEALRVAFDDEGDKITRIKKGQPGADVHHEVRHNNQVCGTIVYDSKNHAQWRTSFITKLKSDQLAARADHAILTTAEFPSGVRQFAVRDGIIVLNPARAVEVVRMLREHIIQTHRLRLSAKEKNTKIEALYKFMNSDRCRQLLDRSESINEQLQEIDAKEVTAHNLVWKKRGQLLKDAQKTHADYRSAIDHIIEDGSLG